MTGSAQLPQNPFLHASAPPLYSEQPGFQGPPPEYDPNWVPPQQPPQQTYYPAVTTHTSTTYAQPTYTTASSAAYAEATARDSAGSTSRAARRTFSWPAAISTGLITLGVTYALDVRNPRALITSILVGTFFGFLGPRERTVRIVERFNPGFHFTQNWGVYYVPRHTQSNHSTTVFIRDWRPAFVDPLYFPSFFRTAYSAPSDPSFNPRTVQVDQRGRASTSSAPPSVSNLHSNYGVGSSNPPLGAAVPSRSSTSSYQAPRASVDVRGGPPSSSTYPPAIQHATEERPSPISVPSSTNSRSASSTPPFGQFARRAAAKQDE